jgi:integrase
VGRLRAGVLCLPDSKVGARDIPIGLAALDLLRALPRMAENPFVSPGRVAGRPLVGLRKIWDRVRTAARLDDLRLHDLQNGFASVGVNRGASLALLQGLLGHASPLTISRYAHLQTDALRVEADGIAASAPVVGTSQIASCLSIK